MSADLDDLLARADRVTRRDRPTRSETIADALVNGTELPPGPWERLRRTHAELMAMDIDDEPGCASRPKLTLIAGGRGV